MNDQNETTQLRFLEETAIRLRQNGFTVEPIEDHHLPVRWEKGRLCRVSGKGSVLYRQENVDSVRTQDALQTVIDTAKMTSEYMAILETAPRLKASGLDGDYRILADFGDAVLAGHPTERGVFQKTPFLSRSSLRRSTARWRSSANRMKAFRLDGIRNWRS